MYVDTGVRLYNLEYIIFLFSLALEIKVFEEEGKIVSFLRLFNETRIDLSYNKSSRIVLLGLRNYVFKNEFKEFVKALAKYIKHIEIEKYEKHVTVATQHLASSLKYTHVYCEI